MLINLGKPYGHCSPRDITQKFGVNPDRYARFSLSGHNGIDYGVPTGTPIIAVDRGHVAEVHDDPDGYGQYVKLIHGWGETLYAHLDRQSVAVGQQVARGDVLGLSGNTGNSTGPHLHFGLRVVPYHRLDGYVGYADPYPYMHESPPNGIIGPHIIGGVKQHIELLQRWQPRLVLVMEPHPNEIAELRSACPHTTIVGRLYRPDSEVADRIARSPKEAARWAHDATMERMIPGVHYWQLQNEVMQQYDELPKLNEFELERMRLADDAGYKCGILAFGVVNPHMPDHDPMALWRQVDSSLAMAEANGHALILHQYGQPSVLQPDPDMHAMRFEKSVRLRLRYRRLRVAVTEFGIDGLLYSEDGVPRGWTNYTDAYDYSRQLIETGKLLDPYRQVIGYCVFTLGHSDPWGTYDIAGQIANSLAAHYASTRADVDVDSVEKLIEKPVEQKKEKKTVTSKETVDRRMSDGAINLNLAIEPMPGGGEFYVKDVFTTISGSWEPSGHEYSLPQWARDAYLKPWGAPDYFDDAGGEQHIFVHVLDEDGKPISAEALFWHEVDGSGNPANPIVQSTGDKKSLWTNLPIYSSFVPDRGERGAWRASVEGAAEFVHGMSLPANQHVSTFIVFQKGVASSSPGPIDPPTDPGPTDPDPVDPPTEPGPGVSPGLITVVVTKPGTKIRIHGNVPYTVEVANG